MRLQLLLVLGLWGLGGFLLGLGVALELETRPDASSLHLVGRTQCVEH